MAASRSVAERVGKYIVLIWSCGFMERVERYFEGQMFEGETSEGESSKGKGRFMILVWMWRSYSVWRSYCLLSLVLLSPLL